MVNRTRTRGHTTVTGASGWSVVSPYASAHRPSERRHGSSISAQELCYPEHEILRLQEGGNRHRSIPTFDDVVGIGAKSIRLFIRPEGQIESEDGESGEKLHQSADGE